MEADGARDQKSDKKPAVSAFDLRFAMDFKQVIQRAGGAEIYMSAHVTSEYAPHDANLTPVKLKPVKGWVEHHAAINRGAMTDAVVHYRVYTRQMDSESHVFEHVPLAWGTFPVTNSGSSAATLMPGPKSDRIQVLFPNGTAHLKLQPAPAYRWAETVTRTRAMKEYADSMMDALGALASHSHGQCEFPSGKKMRYVNMDEMVNTTEFQMPRLLYFLAVSDTYLEPDTLNSFVDHLIRMTCVAEGVSVEGYIGWCKDPMFRARFLPKVIRLMPSTLLYTSGNSWTFPASESDLATSAINCKEMSSLCCLMARYIGASTSKLAEPLREQLSLYHIAHVVCSTTVQNPQTGGRQDGLHAVGALIPKSLVLAMEVEGSKLPDVKSSSDIKALPTHTPVCMLEAIMNTCETWNAREPIQFSDFDHEMPMARFLRPRYPAEEMLVQGVYDSVLCVYLAESPASARQLFPMTTPASLSGTWSIGVKMRDFWQGFAPSKHRHCLWTPLRPTPEQLAIGKELERQVQAVNTIRFHSEKAKLDDARVRQLVDVKDNETIRRRWILYRENDARLSLSKRLSQEVQQTIEKSRQLAKTMPQHAKVLSRYAKEMHADVLIKEGQYMFDGMEDVSLVQIVRDATRAP